MSCTQPDNETMLPPVAVPQPRRALSFISQLPTELLIYAFHWALPYVDLMLYDAAKTSRSYMQMLYIMRQVAKRWQEILDGTPSFWTLILSTLPPHVNNTTILRSSDLPLIVIYAPMWLGYWPPPSKDFLQAMAQTRSRWSAVGLDIHDDDDTYMWEFLETPAPLLQTCVIRGSWDEEEEDTKPLELLGGDTSNLRYVNISVPSVRWKMGMFTQLKALSLLNAIPDGLTIGHILDFLRASPCLEDLDIGGVGITPVGPPASPIITLPYLKSINLSCNSTAVTGSILRHIQMPSCNRFIVRVDMRGEIGHISFIKETFNPFRRILKELHVRNGGSKFSIHSYGFGWESFPKLHRKYGFSVNITGTLDPLAIRWVDQILQAESGLQVDFNLLRAATVSQAALEALAPMQCVTGASIGGFIGTRNKSVSRIFRFLSSPLSSACSLPSLPCLQELLISTTGWTAQELLDMVQFRSSAFPDITTDRPKLGIKVWREPSTWNGSASHIFNLATLTKLRRVEGVESLRFIGAQQADGYSLPKKPGIVVAERLPSGNLSCAKLEACSLFIVRHNPNESKQVLSPDWNSLAPDPTFRSESNTMTPHIQSDNKTLLPVVAVSRLRRALPLISQLPTELLIHTIHLALPSVDVMSGGATIALRSYMRMLYTTRRVAKRWQEIIDGTPSFWRFILSTLPPHINNTTIIRSADLPLTVVYECVWKSGHQSPTEFLRTIAHTRSRWSAADLEIYDNTGMREFLATPAPLLQTVVARGSWDDDQGTEPLELLGGETSNLRYVNISGISIQWNEGLFTQLKALILSNIVNNGLTTSHILDFLRASPCLEYLHIEGAGIAPLRPPSSPIITLPYLKSIDLRSDSSIVTDSILRQIRAPSCSNFTVSVDNENVDGFDPILFINEALNPFQGILRELHVRNGASDLSIDSDRFKWHSFPAPDEEGGFSVSIGDFLDPFAIRWVGQILQKEPGLRVGFGHGSSLNQTVLGALAPMHCGTRVIIGGLDGKAVSRIFRFLGSPLSPSSSLPSLPCLRELLVVSVGWSTQDLLDMVQFRSSTLPYITVDRPKLTIKVWRGAFAWGGSRSHLFDLATLTKLRRVEGVESLRFVGSQRVDGALAITWNDEVSEPTCG